MVYNIVHRRNYIPGTNRSVLHAAKSIICVPTADPRCSWMALVRQQRRRRRMMESTCGRFQAVRVPGCEHVDRGTCGNACCALQISSRRVPTLVYSDLRAWLVSGGADGSYRYVNMSDGAGHRPSDRLGAHVPDKEGGARRCTQRSVRIAGPPRHTRRIC